MLLEMLVRRNKIIIILINIFCVFAIPACVSNGYFKVQEYSFKKKMVETLPNKHIIILNRNKQLISIDLSEIGELKLISYLEHVKNDKISTFNDLTTYFVQEKVINLSQSDSLFSELRKRIIPILTSNDFSFKESYSTTFYQIYYCDSSNVYGGLIQLNKETNHLISFINNLKKTINSEQVFDDFYKALPKGGYWDGYVLMTKEKWHVVKPVVD